MFRKKLKKIKLTLITDKNDVIVGLSVPDITTKYLNRIGKKYNITADQILKEFLNAKLDTDVLKKYGIKL